LSINVGNLPAGQHAGYVTGGGYIQWTSAQWVADPSAVRIDQSPANTPLDETADVLDFESGAANVQNLRSWVENALNNFNAGTRPGQRRPMVYCDSMNVTAVVNTLASSHAAIWLADWNYSLSEAEAAINNASGPYPILAVQYNDAGSYDEDVFSTAWLTDVSGVPGDTVQAGNYGPAVKGLQERLNVWAAFRHVAVLNVDSCFGPVTQSALESFQTYKHLTVDGVAGAATWAALDVNPDPPPPPPPPPAANSYPAPTDLKVVGGRTSFKATWVRPVVPEGLPIPEYQVYVRHNGQLVDSYPRTDVKATAYAGGSLAEHTAYELSVVACGPNGTYFKGSKAATASFTTG
jgi:hypothetical protein